MKITSQKQDFIKRVFTHNLREKLLAVLCTVVVMLAALCFKPLNKVYSVKINTKISPEQVLVSENIDRIEVKVSGNFFELRKVKSEDLAVNFDFSAEKAGEISRNIGNKELPAFFMDLTTENVFPETITLRTEMKKEKNVPVKVVVLENDTESDNYAVLPGEIKIVGAESAVEKLEVLYTEKVKAEAFASFEEIEAALVFPEFTASADNTVKVKIMKKTDESAEDTASNTRKTDETNPENGEKND